MFIELLILTVIVCFLVDISGGISSIKWLIGKLLKINNYDAIRLKPFDCSLCTTFWTGLIYICIIGQFSILNLMLVCICALCSKTVTNALNLVNELLNYILILLGRIIH